MSFFTPWQLSPASFNRLCGDDGAYEVCYDDGARHWEPLGTRVAFQWMADSDNDDDDWPLPVRHLGAPALWRLRALCRASDLHAPHDCAFLLLHGRGFTTLPGALTGSILDSTLARVRRCKWEALPASADEAHGTDPTRDQTRHATDGPVWITELRPWIQQVLGRGASSP